MADSSKYVVRSMFFGLMWKVVIVSDSYERGTATVHLSRDAANRSCDEFNRGEYS